MNVNNEQENEISIDAFKSMIDQYQSLIEKGVNERWRLLDHDLGRVIFFDVLGGLMARQANLSLSFAFNPGIWSPHISALIYRAQIDDYINLAWILEDDSNKRAEQYISYGLGQEKLQLAHLRANPQEKSQDVLAMIKAREDWLNGQLFEELAEVDIGHWAGSNARQMSEAIGGMELYNHAYQEFSAGVHSTWRHVGRHDLRICNNPLHKGHRIPHVYYVAASDLYPLIISAKYMQKTFTLIDDKLKLKCSVEMPMDYILRNGQISKEV